MSKLKMIFSLDMLVAIFNLLFKYIPVYCFVKFKKRPKQLWLFTERPTDARDNGYILYKYLCDKHPELNVCYAIRSDILDYEKVRKIGETIEWGSMKHYYVYLMATLLVSTDFGMCAPDGMMNRIIKFILPPKGKKVFLQHGVTKDSLPQAFRNKLYADLFICGAYPEYEFIKKTFGYAKDVVKYTGFARYDLLENTCKNNQILYMPTWRVWLNNDSFDNSNFANKISALLSSDRLAEVLSQTKTELVFFLHPAMRTKKYVFEKFSSNNIKVINNIDANMQDYIKSAKLLITDFSSVYFDFAYLGKPVVYYQFDYNEYRSKHYPMGYFDYHRDGFGPVICDEDILIEQIKTIINDNWTLPYEYKERSEKFFPLHDKNNCLRHYEALCLLDNIK